MKRVLLGLALLATLPACPKPQVLGPINYGPKGRLENAEVVLDSVLARRDRVKTLRGDAKVSLESPDGSGKVAEFVAACWPTHLRLETMSFFGSPMAVLTSDGTTFALNDFEHQKWFEGAATSQNVSRLLPVELRPEDIVALLFGVPPLLVAVDSLKLEVDETARMYKLTLRSGGAIEVIGLEPATLRPLRVWMNAQAGISAYTATFDDYDETFDLPRRLEVSTEPPRAKVELRWRDRELNQELPVDIFKQKPPPGATSPTAG